MYNKLFTKILDSSIWLAPDSHRLVWITLIAAMDQYGVAEFACVENLAARARVSVDDTRDAIKAFESPDPFDPTQELDGRRIEKMPGGWHVLNAEKYRNVVSRAVANEKSKERMRKHRRKRLKNKETGDGNVTQTLRSVTPSVSEEKSNHEDSPLRGAPVRRPDSGAVNRVFNHWRGMWNNSRARLDTKRRRVITAALQLYDEADLVRSIDGYQSSPHHCGQNEKRTRYDDIEIFLRDAKHIEAGLQFGLGAANGKPPPASMTAADREQLAKHVESLRGSARGVDEIILKTPEPLRKEGWEQVVKNSYANHPQALQ